LISDQKKKEYCERHFENSLNIPIDEVSAEFLSKKYDPNNYIPFTEDNEIKSLLNRINRNFIALIMSKNKIPKKQILKPINNEYSSIGKILTFYNTLRLKKVIEIGIYYRGFDTLDKHYSFLINNPFLKNIKSKRDFFPSDILDHRIFVGRQDHVQKYEVLEYLKISHVVNVTKHISNLYENKGIKYLQIEIDDTPKYSISPHFKIAYDFIENTLKEGELENGENGEKIKEEKSICNSNLAEKLSKIKNNFEKISIINKAIKDNYSHSNNNNRVLVHCSLGQSRSPSIAIMFIMMKLKISFEDAFLYMKFQREKTEPIDTFIYELKELENRGFNF